MKHLIFFSIFFLLFSCQSMLFNAGFEALGIYDDEAKLHFSESDSKKIILLPTHHIGTQLYYDDLKYKIDSLAALNFYFYTERVKAEGAKDSLLRKFRKFSGNPVPSSGYKNIMDSVWGKKYKIKFKKELIDQPDYSDLGVPANQSDNVDSTLEELITYYENNYGEIILAPCDFETKFTEETTCPKYKVSKSIRNDVLQDFRNNIVLNRIDIETRDKIAIIYGAGHTPGLLEGLKARGFQTEE